MSSVKINLFKPIKTEEYLSAAIKTAEFISKNEIVTADGKYWKISTLDNKKPNEVESAFLNQRSLYAGAAGIGYFLIQLYEVSKDEKYLNDAILAGNYLIATYNESISSNPGVHSGAAGEGIFLNLLYKKTADEKYKNQAVKIADDVYRSAKKDENGIHWDGFYDFMGDAGVVIYWLDIAKLTGNSKYITYAGEVLDSILKLKKDYDSESVYWRLFDPAEYFGTLPKGEIVPNFAHGTAGVVYLLTKYYEATNDKKYLEEARKGFNFLEKIAINDGDASIVPYLYFEDESKPYDVFYLGYCHGPSGDGIAVWELYKATHEQKYLDFFKKLTNALIKANVSYRRSSGYWNDCLCCGSAGVLYHFLTASDVEDKYRVYAKNIADKTVNDAYKDEEGYRWYNAWTRIKPWDVDAHLGLYVGAAGSASALLSAYAKLNNVEITPLFEYSDKF